VAELAFGMPALGALLVSFLRRRAALAIAAGLACGLAGLVATSLIEPGSPSSLFGLQLQLPGPAQVVLVASFLAAGLAVLLVPPGADRAPMLASVLAGLSALAVIAVVAQPLVVVVVLLLLASKDVPLELSQRAALVIATIVLAGLCVWIIDLE